MTKALGTHKPYKLVFKDDQPDVSLTTQQADTIRAWLQSSSRFLDMKGEDGLYWRTIAKNDVKSIDQRNVKRSDEAQKYIVCGYGEWHRIEQWDDTGCQCRRKYNNVHELKVWSILKEKWPNLLYNNQIKPEMMKYVKQQLKEQEALESLI